MIVLAMAWGELFALDVVIMDAGGEVASPSTSGPISRPPGRVGHLDLETIAVRGNQSSPVNALVRATESRKPAGRRISGAAA